MPRQKIAIIGLRYTPLRVTQHIQQTIRLISDWHNAVNGGMVTHPSYYGVDDSLSRLCTNAWFFPSYSSLYSPHYQNSTDPYFINSRMTLPNVAATLARTHTPNWSKLTPRRQFAHTAIAHILRIDQPDLIFTWSHKGRTIGILRLVRSLTPNIPIINFGTHYYVSGASCCPILPSHFEPIPAGHHLTRFGPRPRRTINILNPEVTR